MIRDLLRILFKLAMWFGGLLLLFIGVVLFSILVYIEFAGNYLISENEKLEIFEEIGSAKELPQLFYETNEQYFPESYNSSLWPCFFKYYFLNKRCHPESLQVSRQLYLAIKRKQDPNLTFMAVFKRFDPAAVARLIEKNIAKKKCYTFRMRSSSYGDNTRNLEEGSKAHFNKTIEELNETEVLGLHIIEKAPTMYNPKRNPTKYQERLTALIKAHK